MTNALRKIGGTAAGFVIAVVLGWSLASASDFLVPASYRIEHGEDFSIHKLIGLPGVVIGLLAGGWIAGRIGGIYAALIAGLLYSLMYLLLIYDFQVEWLLQGSRAPYSIPLLFLPPILSAMGGLLARRP